MKKIISTFILFFTLSFTVEAQTQQLVAGDIVFLAMQTDSADAFVFANLVNIESGTSIFFTDNGWSGTALFTNEQTVTWTATSFVPAGSVIKLIQEGPLVPVGSANCYVDGPGTATGRMSGLSSSGEQILAYVGSTANPSFIAAISTRNFLATCNTTGAGNTNTTCLPEPLVLGQTAYAATNNTTDFDNIFMNLPVVSGSPAEIAAIVYNTNNWTRSNDPLIGGASQWPNWQINVTGVNEIFTSFTTSSVSLTEGGSTSTVNIAFSPIASLAGSITIQIDVAGGTDPSLNFTTVPAHTNGIITLPVSAGSAQASFTIKANADGITEGTQSGSIEIISASPYLIGTPAQIPITINELPAGVSFISFSGTSENLTVSESAGAINFDITISPAATSVQQFSVQIIPGANFTSQDYTIQGPVNGNVMNFTVQPGESSKSFTLIIIDDAEVENTETITFALSNLSFGLLEGGIVSITLSIFDNDIPAPPGGVVINEIMSGNTSTIADENGNFSDWIEIYNAGLAPVDLAGLYITDSYSNLTKYQFPTGSAQTVIPAGSYKLVWADNQLVNGPLHANFALSSLGEVVALVSSDGTTVIDSITFGPIPTDQSFGRQTDASTTWVIFTNPTPNAANGTSSINYVNNNMMTVTPNPVIDFIQVNVSNTHSMMAEISDLTGKTIVRKILNSDNNTINASELPSGIYHLSLTMNGIRKTGRFIKH